MKQDQADFEISFFEGLVKESPDFVDALVPLAELYTQKGLHKKALVLDRRLARLKPEDPAVHYNLACSLALIGEKDLAFQALERAIETGYHDFEHLIRDSDLKSLHSDPRFQKLAK